MKLNIATQSHDLVAYLEIQGRSLSAFEGNKFGKSKFGIDNNNPQPI